MNKINSYPRNSFGTGVEKLGFVTNAGPVVQCSCSNYNSSKLLSGLYYAIKRKIYMYTFMAASTLKLH